jgi:hypothetical protein
VQNQNKINNQKKKEKIDGDKDDKINYSGVRFEYSRENIHNVGFLCAVEILYQFNKKLPKTMRILKENEVRINFILNYGEVLNGYVGQDQKINEVFTGSALMESAKTLQSLSKIYYEPSIFLQNNFYLNSHVSLAELSFPCDIAKVEREFAREPSQELNRIYKLHYNNYMPQDRDTSHDLKLENNKDVIVKERKETLEKLFRYDGVLHTFVLEDFNVKTQVLMNRPENFYESVKLFFDCLIYNKWNECIVNLRKMRKTEEYGSFRDEGFKLHLRSLEEKIREKITKNSSDVLGDGYTILVRV